MHPNIFTVLLFALHAEGHLLKCYQCTDLLGPCVKEEIMCSTEDALCASQTTVQSIGNASQSTKTKSCTERKMCVNGSVNLGFIRTAMTMECCNKDLCNSQNASDTSSKNPNGKQCYYCDKDRCISKVSCAGSEDHCIKAKVVNSESISMTVKGCASKSMCDVISEISKVYADVSCCQGNLCNSAKSITQNLLVLSWPFISYIMFH